MAEIFISIAAKVSEYLVDPAISHGQYLLFVNKVTKNLENEKMQLISKWVSIQSRVEQAKKRTEIIEDAVEKWLNDVNNLLKEVEKLEQVVKENIGFQGWCPTWRRYCLCKKMAKKTKMMIDIKNNSAFVTFSHLAPLRGIEYICSEKFTYFESTILAYNQLIEALNDESAYIIGLYGMGGSGKTTLVTEVGKKALELNLLDRVISVTVSQTPNVRSIQGKMADMLNLELTEESEEGRAQRLWLRLNVEKRVLIILDDVWVKFNLESIGICADHNNKFNFKVLLTTRRRDVCASMDCQREILLHLLSENESWNLFQMHTGTRNWSSPNLLDVARDVCKECKGLPIAIKAVGSSLRRKGGDEWKVALESLRHSKPFDDHEEEGVRHAFTCLKLSYNFLKNKEAEMLLLICSMFPEDHEIPMEDLVRYGVAMGVCENFNSFELTRSQIKVGINKLVDSCLLLHLGKSVKMHDMIRDVTLWIASKSEDQKILVNPTKDFNSLAEDGGIKDYFAVSSWCHKTNLSYHRLDAPKLEFLLLTIENSSSLNFVFASSEAVKRLKILAIVNNYDEYYDYYYFGDHMPSLSLPQSTWWLTNLRTLRLSNWKLGDLSFLVYLTRLEILDLQRCYIEVLPKGMEKLTQLRLMHLSYCIFSKDFDYEVIGCCSQLEELYFYRNKYHLEGHVEDILALPNLQRFVIQLKWFKDVDCEESNRVLHLTNFNMLRASKHNLLRRAYEIWLEHLHGGCKNIIPDMVRVVGGMKELTNLCFRICSEIECLIDTTHHHARPFLVDCLLPKLVELELLDMENLVELCRGPPFVALGFFENLEKLSIYRCMRLHRIFPEACNLCNLKILNIGMNSSSREYTLQYYKWTSFATLFSMSVTQSLQQLEELCIQGCEKLEHIISSEGDDNTYRGGSSHFMFPNLKKLYIWNCPKLEFVLPLSIVQQGFQKLQEIKIYHVDGLKYVFGQYDVEAHSSQQDQIQVVLPSLKIFKLNYHRNLLGICPERFHLMCPSLEELEWKECPKLYTSCFNLTFGLEQGEQNLDKEREVFWSNTVTSNELCKQRLSTAASQLQVFHMKNCSTEGIFQLQVEGAHSSSGEWKPLNSNLHYLELDDLVELRFIWDNSKFMSLNNLKYVSIVSCPKLKTIFSPCTVRCLPMLETLYIWNCEELEEIISPDPEIKQLRCPNACPQQMSFPRLERISVNRCKKLKCLFYDFMACHFPELQSLAIKECHLLKQVLGFRSLQREGVGEVGEQILFPKLRNLALKSLPIFSEVSPLFDVQQRMHAYSVMDCPNYNSSYRVQR